jgi:hypothetical protein
MANWLCEGTTHKHNDYTDEHFAVTRYKYGWDAPQHENGRSVPIFAKPNHVHDIAFSPEPGVFAYTQFSGGVTVSFVRFIR